MGCQRTVVCCFEQKEEDKVIKTIGLLTGGGDCSGLNAVIRAVTKTAIGRYDMKVYGFFDGFKGLVENDYCELTAREVSGILHRGGTILGSSNRDNPFAFYTNQDGEDVFLDRSDEAIQNMRDLGVEALAIIGGDGTLHIADQFAKKGVKVVGIPKTIDNDLLATDVTFGFHTAVNTASEALDKLHTTADSHHRVMILEVMGRYAGWIALYAGISGGADIILIPEIPFSMEKVVQKIIQREEAGRKFSILVAAEGATEIGGNMTVQQYVKESHDPIRLGGVGNYVSHRISELSRFESRVTVLGHLQRGGSPVPYDRVLSTRYGVAAVEALVQEKYNVMVSLQGDRIKSVFIPDAIEALKKVDPTGELVYAGKAVGINFGD
jgi:6-phosphofructokinase 1